MHRRRAVRRVTMAILPALLMASAGAIPHVAYAGNITSNQIWTNLTGLYVIGVPGGSTTGGVQLITWGSNGHADQFWRFDYTNYGYQTIVNVNSGQCMAVNGASQSLGAAIIQWPCNGHPDQNWRLGGTDGAYAYDTLVNANSSLCVGIAGNSTSQGAKLVQWTCDGNGDKQWIPDSALWPPEGWLACSVNVLTDTCTSYTDPINVVFNDPNRDALGDISNDLAAMGWSATSCFNPLVRFDAGRGQLYTPDNVMATDVSNNGCGSGTRDHVRMWASPDDHTVFMAASNEVPGCSGHCVTSFNDGRNRLINDEDNRLTGRTNFISNEVHQYAAGSLQNVSYDGWMGVFNIGA